MIFRRPRSLVVIGFVMVLFGFATPLLMVIDVIRPSFLLGFLAHASSVGGLFLGIVGAASIVQSSRN